MKMKENIIVVSNNTYQVLRDNAMDTASLQADPIRYLLEWNKLDFVIDNAVLDGMTEVWDRDTYSEFKKEMERIRKKNGDE
jgi:hypothetical protein